jgi:hypothetical protein
MPIADDTCKRAAAFAGRLYGGSLTGISAMPRGCVWYSVGGSFYFINPPNGSDLDFSISGAAVARPVCAGAPGSTYQKSNRAHTCVCVCLCVPVCARTRVRVCVRLCLCRFFVSAIACVCMHASLCACVCVFKFVCLYLCARCAAPSWPPEFKQQSMFAFGPSRSYLCPMDVLPVPSSASCEVAAAVAGKPYGGSVKVNVMFIEDPLSNRYSMPVGCVWWSLGGSFYFNTFNTLAPANLGCPYATPVCAGAPRSGSECNESEWSAWV